MCVCSASWNCYQQLTASRRVNHRFRVGGTSMYWLLPPGPVGVACCEGAVRNSETRWAASHRCSTPRHTHLWCTKQHHHGNKTWPQQTTKTKQQQQHPRCHKTSSSTFCKLIKHSIRFTITYISASDLKGCLSLYTNINFIRDHCNIWKCYFEFTVFYTHTRPWLKSICK